jgi:hypothetical protein
LTFPVDSSQVPKLGIENKKHIITKNVIFFIVSSFMVLALYKTFRLLASSIRGHFYKNATLPAMSIVWEYIKVKGNALSTLSNQAACRERREFDLCLAVK